MGNNILNSEEYKGSTGNRASNKPQQKHYSMGGNSDTLKPLMTEVKMGKLMRFANTSFFWAKQPNYPIELEFQFSFKSVQFETSFNI